MRILLTGGTGFVGAAVLQHLRASDIETALVVRPSSKLWRIEDDLNGTRLIRGDVTSNAVFEAVRDYGPDVVIHLAWQGVAGNERDSLAQLDNVQTSLQFLRLSAEAGAKAWIALGSQAEYGPHSHRIDETAPIAPVTLYGAAKLATCLLSERVCGKLGLRFAWLRLFSVYGPGDNPGYMIPSIIQQLAKGQRPAMTEGRQRWDYLYVSDAAEAVCNVATSASASGIFNVGSGCARSIREIAGMLQATVAPDVELGWGEVPYAPNQVMHLEADIGRITATTGWAPRVSLQEGLAKTAVWFSREANLNHWQS